MAYKLLLPKHLRFRNRESRIGYRGSFDKPGAYALDRETPIGHPEGLAPAIAVSLASGSGTPLAVRIVPACSVPTVGRVRISHRNDTIAVPGLRVDSVATHPFS